MNNRNEIKDALRLGSCNLVYTTLAGESRVTTGTLKLELIPEEFQPKNPLGVQVDAEPDASVRYFDFGKTGWRTFYPENLQSLSVVS